MRLEVPRLCLWVQIIRPTALWELEAVGGLSVHRAEPEQVVNGNVVSRPPQVMIVVVTVPAEPSTLASARRWTLVLFMLRKRTLLAAN